MNAQLKLSHDDAKQLIDLIGSIDYFARFPKVEVFFRELQSGNSFTVEVEAAITE